MPERPPDPAPLPRSDAALPGIRRRSLGHFLGVLLFFAFTSALYTYPLVRRLPTAILPGVGDYPSESALITWNAHQVLHAPAHLFDTRFFYPYSNTQAYWQSLFFPGLLAAPVLALSGEPLLATNVVVLAQLILSGVFTYGVAFALTGRVVPSLLAGFVYAHFPNRMDHLGTPLVQMGCLLPVILWACYRFLATTRWRDLLLLVAALWAQALSSLYYAFASGFLLLSLFFAWALIRPQQVSASLLWRGAVGMVLLTVVLGPFLLPYLHVHRELGFARDVAIADLFGMDVLSLFDIGAASFNRIYPSRVLPLEAGEGGLFPGFVVLGLMLGLAWAVGRDRGGAPGGRWIRGATRLLLVVTALCLVIILAVTLSGRIRIDLGPIRLHITRLTLWANLVPLLAFAWIAVQRRPGANGPLSSREWSVILLALTALAYCLTLSPTLRIAGRPWGVSLVRWIHDYVPGGAAFRAPGRWALIFVLPLALAAALAMARLEKRLPGRVARLGSVLLLLGTMVEYRTFPIPWSRVPPTPPVYRWLRELPGDFAVVELPANDSQLSAWAMFWAAFHRKRLVNGAFVFTPPGLEELADTEAPPDLPALVAALQSIYPLRYVIAHEAAMPVEERARWRALRSTPIPGLSLDRRFGDSFVYAVAGVPQSGVELHRYFSTDFTRRHPVAEFALRLEPSDADVRRWVDVSFNGRLLTRSMSGSGTVRLPPPLRAGDRNELRFTHRYEVPASVTLGDAYRVGRTGSHSPVDIEVRSRGSERAGAASLRINGLAAPGLPLRGYNVAALDPRSGAVLAFGNFDTFKAASESRRMGQFVDGLPAGTLVVAAVKSDGGGQLSEAGIRALRAVGSATDLRNTLFRSHALVGIKGAAPGEAVEASGDEELTVTVGRARRFAVVLERFTLR